MYSQAGYYNGGCGEWKEGGCTVRLSGIVVFVVSRGK